MKYLIKIQLFLFILLIVGITPYTAADSWTFGFTPQLYYANYKDAELRESMSSFGFFATADYLDNGGFRMGYDYVKVKGKAGNPDIDENNINFSGRYVYYPDSLPGKLSFRLDGYSIKDKYSYTTTTAGTPGRGKRPGTNGTTTTTNYSDDISAIYAQMDFMDFAETYYIDAGYALSQYDYDDSFDTPPYKDNDVTQITATFGFAFNNRYDWLQSRGYFIRLDHGENTEGLDHSNALELKWLHWFKPNAFLNPHSSFIKLLAGKRFFWVDPDASSVSSIVDQQTRSVALGMDWKLSDHTKFLLMAGYDRYVDLYGADEYDSRSVYSNLSFTW